MTEENLTNLQCKQQNDEQVYQINQVDQVMEQSLNLIKNAEHKLMVEAEPNAVPFFKEALEQAAQRGVEVWAKIYLPENIKGVNTVVREKGHEIYARTNDISFKFAADGRTMLIADITSDAKNVIQAFRSNSALMSMSIYSALLYEIILTDLKQLIPNKELEAANQLLQRTAHLHPMSTKNEVFQHYETKYHNLRNQNNEHN